MVRALVTAAALGLAGAVCLSAAEGAEGGLSYIVPAAAGSADGQSDAPDQRPAMPDLIFADGSSLPVHLRQYLGQVVVINFWASWCGPCIKEMVFLDRLQGDFRGQPFTVLAASEDTGGIPAARRFLTRQKFTYLTPFADPGAGMAKVLGVRGLPTSIIIDRHGRQVLRVEGPYQWDSPQIAGRIRRLLAER